MRPLLWTRPSYRPWEFMLDVDDVNYSLAEGAEVVGRLGRPLLDVSSGVNGHPPPEVLLRALIRGISSPSFHHIYDGPAGHPLARAAVRTFEQTAASRPLGLTDDNVLVTTGVSPALHLLNLYLAETAPDGELLLPVPTFPLGGAAAAFVGLAVREVGHDGPEPVLPTVAEIAAAAGPRTRCIFLNLFNNPTGECYGADDLRALLRFAAERDVLVVVDRVSADLGRGARIPNPLDLAAELGCPGSVVIVSSVSKDRSLPGLRLGWLVGPRPLVDRLVRYNSHVSMSSQGPSAALIFLDMLCRAATRDGAAGDTGLGAGITGVAEAFRAAAAPLVPVHPDISTITGEFCDPHFLSGLVGDYLRWRQQLLQLMQDNWSTVEKWAGDGIRLGARWQGGFNTFVHLPALDAADPYEFAVSLFREQGVQILPGPSFGLTPDVWRRRYGFWTRLSFAMDRTGFAEGLDLLLGHAHRWSGR